MLLTATASFDALAENGVTDDPWAFLHTAARLEMIGGMGAPANLIVIT